MKNTFAVLLFILLPSCFILIPSCASDNSKPTTRPMTERQRQDQAMKDPFNYSPNADRTDISGGGLTDFDRDAFNRDVKNVLDP